MKVVEVAGEYVLEEFRVITSRSTETFDGLDIVRPLDDLEASYLRQRWDDIDRLTEMLCAQIFPGYFLADFSGHKLIRWKSFDTGPQAQRRFL